MQASRYYMVSQYSPDTVKKECRVLELDRVVFAWSQSGFSSIGRRYDDTLKYTLFMASLIIFISHAKLAHFCLCSRNLYSLFVNEVR